MNNLPDDLVYEVMTHLELNELINLCQTNKSSYCQDERLWKALYLKHFGEKIIDHLYLNNFKLAYLLTNLQTQIKYGGSIKELYTLSLLDLWGKKLPSLPKEIGLLTHLKKLEAGSNNLTSIPSEIGLLTNLEILELEYNFLTTLPPEIGQLKKLNHLILNNNKLQSLPDEMGQLQKLKVLTIQFNPIQSYLSALTLLKNTMIFISRNQVKFLPPGLKYTIADF